MHRKLLEILADPATGDPLRLLPDDGAEDIIEGALISPSGARYQIERGIPRFVPRDNYSASFGIQWTRFSSVQLDSVTGASYSRTRFLSEVPWADEIKASWVVDAGCGSGRFAEIAADHGAEVIAVDLSSAVDAAHANLGHRPNVHVIQADLRALPLRREAVSFLYSLGVLQHTPQPLRAAHDLVAFLPHGGRFAFTIYGHRRWTRIYSKYWLRPLTTRVAPTRLLSAIEKAMPILFPLTSTLFRIPVAGRFFRFLLPVANYVERRDLPRSVRYSESILDTFDMLAPKYDRPVTSDEIEAILAPVAKTIRFSSKVPVVVAGTRR